MSSVNVPNMQSFPPQHLMEFNNDFLLTQIKNQVEFYFAPQNLQNDKFLQSQLNATDHLGAVSIQVICSFRKIRQLYSYSRSGFYPHDADVPADPALLRMALASSNVVSISHDGMWIVPNIQKEPQKDSNTEATVASIPSSPSSSQDGSPQQVRNTLILVDIADTVTEAMVLEAFAKFDPKVARKEAVNVWQVIFGSSENAAASLEAEIKLNGTPVKGFLKSDMPGVPTMPLPPPAPTPMLGNNPNNMMGYPAQYPMQQPPPQYNYVPVQYGMPQMMPQPHYPIQPQYYPQPQYRYFPPAGQRPGGPPPQNVFLRPSAPNNSDNNGRNVQGNNAKRRNNGAKRKGRKQQQHQQQPPHDQGDRNTRKQMDGGGKKQPKNGGNGKKEESPFPKQLDFSHEHFPSLGGGKDTTQPSEVEGSAYAQALLKSTKKDVADSMKEMSLKT